MLRAAGTVPTSATSATVVPLHPLRARRLAEAQVVAIADRVSAIVFDSPGLETRRLAGTVDGQPLGRPLISTSLALKGGGTRHLLLVGLEARGLARARVVVALDGEPAAAIDPDWLQSPLADSAALIDGLSPAGRRRLLKLFLSTGSSLFGLDGATAFGAAAHRLLALLGVAPVAVASCCPVGASARLLSFRVAPGTDAARIGTLVALSAGRIVRLAGSRLRVEDAPRGSLLHVFLPGAVPEGTALIGLGETPVHLRAPGADTGLQALVPWLRRRSPGTQAWVQGLVEGAAADPIAPDPLAAAQLREFVLADAPAPKLVVRHLSGTPEGVLHAFAVEDPAGLVRAVRLERGGAVADLPLAAATGYAPVGRRPRADDRFRLRLVYHSGRLQTVAEGRLAAYRGDVPAAFDLADPEMAATVARARLALERLARPASAARFGAEIEAPSLSMVAPVGDNLDVVRARAAVLFAEPGGRTVEIVYHVAAGPLAAAARAAVAGTAQVYGLAHRLVTVPEEADDADRLVAALGACRGDRVLLLGADVLPAGMGWLSPWLCGLDDATPVIGGTLLDTGGAVADAGGGAAGAPRLVGLPAVDLPAEAELPTLRVTAACVGLTRAAAERMCAETARYPNPDVMLAETVARLAGEGGNVTTRLRSRFVRYGAAATDARAERVDAAAMALVLKRSFRASGEEGAA